MREHPCSDYGLVIFARFRLFLRWKTKKFSRKTINASDDFLYFTSFFRIFYKNSLLTPLSAIAFVHNQIVTEMKLAF